MGLNPFWQEDVLQTVQEFCPDATFKHTRPYCVIKSNDHFFIHLVPIKNDFNPHKLIELQQSYQKAGQQLIHLWEDVWLAKRAQVLSRIHSFLGMNQSIHGRKAKVVSLEVSQAKTFLTANHLQGYVKAAYHYGLVVDDELVALASFSEPRLMKTRGDDYRSAELIRFASKGNFTVVGGLSKLIKYFASQVPCNDLMTSADRDWSLGKGYDRLGFVSSKITEPATLYVDQESLIRYFPHRLPKNIVQQFGSQNVLNLDEFLEKTGFYRVFNTGNLTYHLYF